MSMSDLLYVYFTRRRFTHFFTSLHFTSLHFTSLYFISLYFTSLYFTSLHFTSLYFTSLHFTLLYFTSLHFTSLHFTLFHFTLFHFTLFHFTSLHFTSLHFISLHFTSLHFISLCFTSLHFTLLHFTSLHFTSLHFTSLRFTSLHFTSLLVISCASHVFKPFCHAEITLAHHRFHQLDSFQDQKDRGVITASSGNHGIALAFHGQALGIPVHVVLPENSPLIKQTMCKNFGAKVIIKGSNQWEASMEKTSLSSLKWLSDDTMSLPVSSGGRGPVLRAGDLGSTRSSCGYR